MSHSPLGRLSCIGSTTIAPSLLKSANSFWVMHGTMSLPIMTSFKVVRRMAAHGMDVDGTKMSKIKLQGREDCYSFTAADAGESAASSADEEEEDTENEGTDCDTDEMDEIEVVSESEPDSDDESEDEGPENADEHGNFEVPDGMHVLPQPPVNFSVASLKTFKLKIALKWPFGDEFGWEIGKIIKLVTRAGQHKGSFVIRFEDGIY